MSDFTKTTNFTSKDSLLSGDPDKVVRGAELDTEFDAIQTAIATKYDSGDTGAFATGTTIGNLTLANGSITDSSGAISFGNENLSTTGTFASGAQTVTGNIAVSGTVDGRDIATDGTKLDGIETAATADQTGAEIKALYEAEANTNAFTDADQTTLADAVLNADTTTASMSFVIDEDNMASDSATKVPTQQSTKKYVDDTVVAIGALMVTGTPVLNDFARFTSASDIEGRSYAEVRADLSLEVGTDVQAYDAGLTSLAGLTTAADKMVYTTASDTYAVTDLSSFGRTLIDDASASAARTTLGVAIGTDVQAYDADTAKLDVVQTFTAAQTINSLTLGGELAGADNTVSRVNLKDYGEVTNAIGSIGGGTQDIDITSGNVVTATVDTSTTTFTFSNPTASDEGSSFTLILVNGGSQTVNWPASVDWAGGTAPTLTAAGTDVLEFLTVDGGTTWYGFAAGIGMA